MRHLPVEGQFAAAFQSWRDSALRAIGAGWTADSIQWSHDPLKSGTQGLIDYASGSGGDGAALRHLSPAPLRVSKELSALLSEAALYRDGQRWSFLYHVLWRWSQGDRTCASAADVDGAKLHRMAKAVRRDKHDMIAYVRFRQPSNVGDATDAPDYIAEYSPEHDVLAWAADHFAERMGRSSWLISTPDAIAMSDGHSVSLVAKPNQLLRPDTGHAEVQNKTTSDFFAGSSVAQPPDAMTSLPHGNTPDVPDDAESLWLVYYRSTFNPARVSQRGLEQHMPVRYWKGLPEAALIPGMLSAANTGQRTLAQSRQIGLMPGRTVLVDAAQAQPRRDPATTLDKCRRCDLWRTATQVVPGCGPLTARIVLIGEQPGDQEDLAGRPFVGPAGKLLDSAMQEAGLSRDSVYLTNAVKHFKWTPKGKRRIHKTPQQREIEACRGWLEEELATIQPAVIVTLGASALASLKSSLKQAPAMLGNSVLLTTRHPAYALRQTDPDARIAIFNEIVDTLRGALRHCDDSKGNPEVTT